LCGSPQAPEDFSAPSGGKKEAISATLKALYDFGAVGRVSTEHAGR
jgi:hypothetical protein